MSMLRLCLGALIVAALCGSPLLAYTVAADRELEEAKSLYRDARFPQAIARLQEAISQLRRLPPAEVSPRLADAHLHLALSYLGLSDTAAAKESLKDMARVDPSRRLDPDVYAPKVIELMQEARAEVARELRVKAGTGADTRAGGWSKSGPILLGVGGIAATAGGLAVAAGGGSSATPTPTTTPRATTAPTLVPTPSGSGDIVLVGIDPPSGSTLSLATLPRERVATLTLSVLYSQTGSYSLAVLSAHDGQVGFESPCLGVTSFVSLNAGETRTQTVVLRNQAPSSTCPLPANVIALQVHLTPFTHFESLMRRDFAISYRLLP